MMRGLQNKIAIVTGAGQGIGQAIAVRLAQEGADVAVSDINLQSAEQTASQIRQMDRRSLALKADVANFEDVRAMVEKSTQEFGRVDILVNNAGVTKDNLLVRMTQQQWDWVISVNLKGTFNCTKAVVPLMMRSRYGRIINIASVIGLVGNAGQANYAASKAGIIGLTKSAAKELASRGITVNAVAPGYIQTEMTERLPEQAKEAFLKTVPLQRVGLPQDVAGVVAFLASEDASYITGQVINIDGGMVM
ncbi:MAG: 3-oxoacyl-[acyl-carrier-protein] reductase [Candidatus Latescibacteria bacterium]|nr:3-oxoacyl-[acyl-carrier-protein] reductase [Candidatus Latescibacterota bacterium]